jgi:hypothetical protein
MAEVTVNIDGENLDDFPARLNLLVAVFHNLLSSSTITGPSEDIRRLSRCSILYCIKQPYHLFIGSLMVLWDGTE